MKYCTKCGNELKSKDLYCSKCGTKVEKELKEAIYEQVLPIIV